MGCAGLGVPPVILDLFQICFLLFQIIEAMALYHASFLSFYSSYGILVLNLRLFWDILISGGSSVFPAMGEPDQLKRAMIDATAGAISGALSRTITSPLDVIKIRFQVSFELIVWNFLFQFPNSTAALTIIFEFERRGVVTIHYFFWGGALSVCCMANCKYGFLVPHLWFEILTTSALDFAKRLLLRLSDWRA